MQVDSTNIGGRIKSIRNLHKLTQEVFADSIGVTRSVLSQIELGINNPSVELIAIIKSKYKTTYDFLIGGSKEDDSQTQVVNAFKTDDSTGVPLLNVVALAGFGNSTFAVEKENVVGYYNIPEFKTADFFIPMKGKSMLPYYPHGAILACKIVTEESYLQWGKPYLIATKGQGLIVKRITKGKSAKFWTLVSDNDKLFQPYDIPVSEVDGTALILGCATLYFE